MYMEAKLMYLVKGQMKDGIMSHSIMMEISLYIMEKFYVEEIKVLNLFMKVLQKEMKNMRIILKN